MSTAAAAAFPEKNCMTLLVPERKSEEWGGGDGERQGVGFGESVPLRAVAGSPHVPPVDEVAALTARKLGTRKRFRRTVEISPDSTRLNFNYKRNFLRCFQ